VSATLAVLGAGAILPRVGYGCSGYALRPAPGAPVTLLDCGPGSLRALPGVGIEPAEVQRVVLSHFHLDHCLDLFALAFARHSPRLAGSPPLELVGPPGLAALLSAAPAALGRWATFPGASVLELRGDPARDEGRACLERADLRLEAVPNGHTPDSLSWRVQPARPSPAGDWSLLYTGDTPEDPRVARLGRGVELFLSECSFGEAEAVPNHLTPRGAARLALAAGAGRLCLTHFYPGLDPERARAEAAEVFDGPVLAARDGRVLELGI